MTAARLPPKPTGRLVTAEGFLRDYCEDYEELIDGVLVEKGTPSLRHGQVCSRADYFLSHYLMGHPIGQMFSNDPHILIHRDPDRVRGPDLCFFSFDRLPAGPAPEGVTDLVPDLTVEIRSPSNTWSQIFGKVGDYLKVGVRAVVVLDADSATASVYRRDELQKIFTAEQELTIPDVLPGFAVPVGKFFA